MRTNKSTHKAIQNLVVDKLSRLVRRRRPRRTRGRLRLLLRLETHSTRLPARGWVIEAAEVDGRDLPLARDFRSWWWTADPAEGDVALVETGRSAGLVGYEVSAVGILGTRAVVDVRRMTDVGEDQGRLAAHVRLSPR